MTSKLFFLVGRGRSGTTLLSRMLLKHPEIVVAPEGFFAVSLERRYGDGDWNASRAEAFCRDLLLENRMKTWKLDVDALRARLAEQAQTLSYPEVCRLVYENHARAIGKADARWLGDKNPHYALFVRRIARRFSDARFVHIVRDPRDNVCSYRTVPFDLGNIAALADRWRRYNEEILAAQRLKPERFVTLRYEDLLADPTRVLTRVCRFLEVEFDTAMLSFHEADPQGFYGERSRWFAGLRKPLDPSRSERWQDELSEANVRQIEAICGSLARELGYEIGEDRSLGASPAGRLGQLLGWGSVAAEKLVFRGLPVGARSAFINLYRRSSGRV